MNTVSVNLMKLVGRRCRQILTIGKKLLEKLEDGLISKMIITLWTSILWKVFGGYLKNYGPRV